MGKKAPDRKEKKPTVAFVHPDLGVGGAERLVVDAAVGLQGRGYSVRMFTSHHDPSHCFQETRDGTLDVTVYGDWLPRSILGGLQLYFAILRQLWLTIRLLLGSTVYDVIIVDQLSACVPLLRWKARRVLFYCHYPDLRLTTRESLIKKIYRYPLDALEAATTARAHGILVNSKYTKSVFHEAFPNIDVEPGVLYPAINFSQYGETNSHAPPPAHAPVTFLSINRFERKKNLDMALHAFAEIRARLHDEDRDAWRKGRKGKAHTPFKDYRLVIAGGYDSRVLENVQYHEDLRELASELQLESQVDFVRSFSEEQRAQLLRDCRAVVYTPENEHFGIVPIEAMYCRRAVVAVASGGPLESVKQNETGFLCEPNALLEEMADAIMRLADDHKLAVQMGNAAQAHAAGSFDLDAFVDQLEGVITELLTTDYVRKLTKFY